jgi:hypothetical protein
MIKPSKTEDSKTEDSKGIFKRDFQQKGNLKNPGKGGTDHRKLKLRMYRASTRITK